MGPVAQIRGRSTSRWLAVGGVVVMWAGVAACSGAGLPGETAEPEAAFSISSHRTGETVNTSPVDVSGTAQPGDRIVQDISFGGDRETTADTEGDWTIEVELDEGRNELTFRLDDDDETATTLVLVLEPEVAEATPRETPSPTPADTVPGTIGLTPDEFVAAWDLAATEAGAPEMLIGSVVVETGQVQDVWQHEINPSVVLQGTVNKADGSMREATILIGGGDMAEAAGGLLAMALLIQVVSPDLAPTERGDLLDELGLFEADVDLGNIEASANRGDIEYTLQGLTDIGVFFIADGEPD